jgi:hypothetical protein
MDTLRSAADKIVRAFKENLERFGDGEEFSRLASEFHTLKGDPKQKLIEKDRALINMIANFKFVLNLFFQASDITKFEYILFLGVAEMMEQIEHIFWELKQHTGVVPPEAPEPKPDPIPEPPSGPEPGQEPA